VCVGCGRQKKARFRRIIATEKEAAVPLANPDFSIRRIARKLFIRFQHRDLLRAQPLIRQLGGVVGESDVERVASYGAIRLIYQPVRGSLHLKAIRLLDRPALGEIAEPGSAKLRRTAIDEARLALAHVQHPQAEAIAEWIRADSAETLHHQTIRALAGLARLVESGDVIPARIFSSSVLGHSKALHAMRRKLERMVGPLERLGVREAGQIVIMGGIGKVVFLHSTLNLDNFRHVGVSHKDALSIERIDFPSGGLLVVENLTPFEACVDVVARKQQLMVLWTAGFAGKGVLHVIRKGVESKIRIRVWCDLDLGGVRIARSILNVAASAEPILMNKAAMAASKTRNALTPDQLAALRRDLTVHPAEPLAETVRALVEANVWVEQEALIERITCDI
jgi:hypothetical protein